MEYQPLICEEMGATESILEFVYAVNLNCYSRVCFPGKSTQAPGQHWVVSR